MTTFFADNNVYAIKDRCVYRHHVGEDGWNMQVPKTITNSSDISFNFLIFKPDDHASSATQSKAKLWLYIVYICDILLVLICAWLLKQLRAHKKMNKRGELYFWDDIAMPSEPPVVMEALKGKGECHNDDSPYTSRKITI